MSVAVAPVITEADERPDGGRHLDLGCGKRPRNPYGRQHLCGVDIRRDGGGEGFEFRAANVVTEPIPYHDAHFASVSAFDFVEHVPRILATPDGGTVFPFIRLMNEVWRVLEPGGRFYAVTPAYPHEEAFRDPTHVNIITAHTHEYFCGERPLGRMYGFSGHFHALRTGWVHVHEAYDARPGAREAAQPVHKRAAHTLRDGLRRLRGKPGGNAVYFLWELEARPLG